MQRSVGLGSKLGGARLDAELIPLGIGEDDPSAASRAPITDDGGSQSDESVDLLLLGSIRRDDVHGVRRC